MLRAMPMSPSVYTQLAIGMRTHMHPQQVTSCSKRMYIRISFHCSNHMTMRVAWHITRPLQRPERTRTGLRITHSDDMRVKQRGSTCDASRLDERLNRPGDTYSVRHCVMDDVIRIAKVGGTHVAADVPMCVARPQVSVFSDTSAYRVGRAGTDAWTGASPSAVTVTCKRASTRHISMRCDMRMTMYYAMHDSAAGPARDTGWKSEGRRGQVVDSGQRRGIACPQGRRVAVFDVDQQGNLTTEDLGVPADEWDKGRHLAAVMQYGADLKPYKNIRPNLDVVMGGPSLSLVSTAADKAADAGIDIAENFRQALGDLCRREGYDVVLVDSGHGDVTPCWPCSKCVPSRGARQRGLRFHEGGGAVGGELPAGKAAGSAISLLGVVLFEVNPRATTRMENITNRVRDRLEGSHAEPFSAAIRHAAWVPEQRERHLRPRSWPTWPTATPSCIWPSAKDATRTFPACGPRIRSRSPTTTRI